MYLTSIGEDTLLVCDACGFRANRQVAAFGREAAPQENALPLEEVATPDTTTIDDLTELLGIPRAKTAKAVFLVGEINDEQSKLVFALIRGDLEVNETKLANAAGVRALRPAHPEEIAAIGAVAGYASPVGLESVEVIADTSIAESPNLVTGANREGFHLKNANFDRDFSAPIVTDIAAAEAGHPCPECGKPLGSHRGVELGNFFKLGTRYSETMGCYFLDENGKRRPVIMGSYGIGIGRLLASVTEEHNDSDGLIWPVSISPYSVHLVALKGADEEADKLYEELRAEQIDVLYDDRAERPGVKFKDADLIGIPIRLTVSARSLENNAVETKLRHESERGEVDRASVRDWVKGQLRVLGARLEEQAGKAPGWAD